MKRFIAPVAAFVVFVAALVSLAASPSQPGLASFSEPYLSNATRSCYFPPGGWTIVDCSNAVAATSAQLRDWSRYVIMCGDDSYIATGDDATDVADANDGWLARGAWLEFLTTADVRYVSCLNITNDRDCRYIECR